jgi:hypothetical protein
MSVWIHTVNPIFRVEPSELTEKYYQPGGGEERAGVVERLPHGAEGVVQIITLTLLVWMCYPARLAQ